MIHLYTWTDELLFINWRTTKNFFKAGSFLSVLVTSDKRYWCFATSSQLSLRKLFLVLLNWIELNWIEVKNFRTLWVISTLYKNTRACLLSRAANHWEGHIPLAWNSVYIHDPAEVVILQNNYGLFTECLLRLKLAKLSTCIVRFSCCFMLMQIRVYMLEIL